MTPQWGQNLIAVVNPDKTVTESDESNNAKALVLPSLSITWFEWNRDRDGTLANSSHRGVDYNYEIGNSDLPLAPDIGFYWADASMHRISPELSRTEPLRQTEGTHEYFQGGSESFSEHNDPAHWPTPPPGATYPLAVADPGDKLVKVAEDPSDSNPHLIQPLVLAKPWQILKGSVSTDVTGPTITAEFTPGSGVGLDIPISEAEVVLGMDHFNWLQQVWSMPPGWKVWTFRDLWNR